MAATKAYSFGTFDCFSDMSVCLQITCCGACCIPTIAEKIKAEDTHDWPNNFKAGCATYFWMCGLCCCPEHICPCYLSSLLDRSMQYHGITVHPGPCGQTKCCGCYLQMCLQCTAPCTLCVMYREANLAQVNGVPH